MNRYYIPTEYRLIILQVILLLVAAALYGWQRHWDGLGSVLLGGGAWILPSFCFSWRWRRIKSNPNPHVLVSNFFVGELLKLLLSAALIIGLLLVFSLETWGFLSGYSAAVAASFLLPLVNNSKNL